MNHCFFKTVLIAFLGLWGILPGWTQGTVFSYQGRLNDGSGGSGANGAYDLLFTLYDSPTNSGMIVGGPVTNSAVAVSNGLFMVTVDFGAGAFTGAPRWLAIAARTNGGGAAFVTLNPLQPITATPYAILAGTLSGTLPSGALSGVYSGAVTLANPGNAFNGNGGGLSNVNAATLGGLGAGAFWQLGGNSNTMAGLNFVGTTDNQPLELKVMGSRAFRWEPNTNGAPNLIGGAPVNFVDPGIYGATIGGGGAQNFGGPSSNHVGAIFGTISGGRGNTVSADHSTIAGGYLNSIDPISYDSVISGGVGNWIQSNSWRVTIAGGGGNVVGTNSNYGRISGGLNNTIQDNAYSSGIGGGNQNTIDSGAIRAAIGGGHSNTILTNGDHGTIGGGELNIAASHATVGGGYSNAAVALDSFIGGGANNTVSADHSTVGGGYLNSIDPLSFDSVVGGGVLNRVQSNSWRVVVGGGFGNTIGTNSSYVVIAGGADNTNQDNVYYSSIGGGFINSIGRGATYSTISGGYANTVSNYAATVAGGDQNAALGIDSFAAGHRAKALHDGAFVWGDATDQDISSTASNQFVVRASGGVQFVGAGGSPLLAVNPNGWLAPGAGISSSNAPLEFWVAGNRVLRLEGGTNGANVIGGSATNSVAPGVVGATIGGGGATSYSGQAYSNTVASDFGTIGGGAQNSIGLFSGFSTVGGGTGNAIGYNAVSATISGGQYNLIRGDSQWSSINGGWANVISNQNQSSSINGGYGNLIADDSSHSVIGGGWLNQVGRDAQSAVIAGGGENAIGPFSYYSTIGGGAGNYIGSRSIYAVISGGGGNTVADSSSYATISGGTLNTVGTNSTYSLAAGGYSNSIGSYSGSSVIVGGYANAMGTNDSGDFIGGGSSNLIQDSGAYDVLGGGLNNNIQTGVSNSVLMGGFNNILRSNSLFAVVPGGRQNTAGSYSFAAGYNAQALNPGTFVWADSLGTPFVSSSSNQFLIRATGGVGINLTNPGAPLEVQVNAGQSLQFRLDGGLVPGINVNDGGGNAGILRLRNAMEIWPSDDASRPGRLDVRNTSGVATVVLDGQAGAITASTLAGNGNQPLQLRASFVGVGRPTPVTGADMFSIESPATNTYGGMYVNTTGPGGWPFYGYAQSGSAVAFHFVDASDGNKWKLFLGGATRLAVTTGGQIGVGVTNPAAGRLIDTSSGAYLTTAGVWTSTSDRNAKEEFSPIDAREVLNKVATLPITQWKYKVEPEGVKHLGPVAQDFHAAFGLGDNDRTISTIDEGGVALAAIQGLNQKLEQKETEIAELRRTVAELKQMILTLKNK